MSQTLNVLRRLQLSQINSKIICKSLFSNVNKDVIKPGSVSLVSKQDLLLQDLKSASNTNGVLHLVSSHYKIMNSMHLMQALRSLFILQKAGNSEVSTQKILNHPDFEKICSRLRTKIGTIELNDTIEALKVVCYVGVSSDSTIVQVLLQLIRHNINELSLPQIIFLDFLLKQFNSSPLIDALKIALPLVFEIQLPMKMDRDNIAHIAEYLHYVSKSHVSDKCVENIVLAALKCRNKMDAKTAISLIWSLCDMKPDQFFEPLLKEALHVVTMNMENLSFNEMETTLAKLINKHSARSNIYYNELFMDLLSDYLINKELGLKQAQHMLRKFNRISYVSNNLLDYVAKECEQNPELILYDPMHAYNTAINVATTDYRPPHWDSLKTALENTEVFHNPQRKDIYWLKLAASMITLDIYKREVFENAFSTNNLQAIMKKNYMSDAENFILLYSFITLFKPEFTALLPERSVFEEFQRKIKPPVDYPLEVCLQKGLGGENYVMTNVKSELGFVIDHVILLRSGGFALAFNSMYIETLEKLNVSADSQIVLVLGLPHFHYTINCRRMKGTTALMIKILEAKGYTVVPICLEEWNDLPDFEKIPYVMQAIKNKTEYNEVILKRL